MAPPQISFADLIERARSLPPEVRADPNRLTFTMAVTVIRHFFGKQWCEDHIIQDAAHSRPDGFQEIPDPGLSFRTFRAFFTLARTADLPVQKTLPISASSKSANSSTFAIVRRFRTYKDTLRPGQERSANYEARCFVSSRLDD
jgi:hypothetical protein